ncbi:MAG: urea ABC transporter permease subunit UrtB [Granulosicoccus sp.]
MDTYGRTLPTLLLLLISLLTTSTQLYAEITTGDPELDALFTEYLDARSAQRAEVLERLATLERDDVRPLLQGILDGNIMVEKKTSRVVRVIKRGRQYELTTLLGNEELGTVKKRALKRLPLNNSLRSHLRALIAGLGLGSVNKQERLEAVNALMKKPDSIATELLDNYLDRETDLEVITLLRTVQARQFLSSGDPAKRLEGLATLESDLGSASRRAIANLADNDSDESVRDAATLVRLQQTRRVKLYGYVETLFFGLSLGSVLVLAAIGLAITFGVMGVINMAHGELIMLGAYSSWAVQQLLPESLTTALILAVPIAFLVAGIAGILIERLVIRYLYGRPLETLLATFGISLILQQAVRTLVSPQNVAVANPPFMSGVVEINSVLSLTLNRLWILAFCLLVFMALLQLLKRTRFGLEVRAVAANRGMARALGVRSSRIDSLTFGLGAGIAGIAGVALSQLTNVGPNLGQAYIVDSFMVVVFGGVGNLWGTLIGGMTLGIANKFLEPWAGAILAKILVLVFLILFIQKRPRGLFPQRGRAAESH